MKSVPAATTPGSIRCTGRGLSAGSLSSREGCRPRGACTRSWRPASWTSETSRRGQTRRCAALLQAQGPRVSLSSSWGYLSRSAAAASLSAAASSILRAARSARPRAVGKPLDQAELDGGNQAPLPSRSGSVADHRPPTQASCGTLTPTRPALYGRLGLISVWYASDRLFLADTSWPDERFAQGYARISRLSVGEATPSPTAARRHANSARPNGHAHATSDRPRSLAKGHDQRRA